MQLLFTSLPDLPRTISLQSLGSACAEMITYDARGARRFAARPGKELPMALRSLSYVLFVEISVKIVDNQCTDTTSNGQ